MGAIGKNTFETRCLSPVLNQIALRPSENAFFIGGKYYTYNEFGCAIAGIYTSICSLEIEDSIFGLVVHDDIDTYASIFALWLLGKTYVPLHPFQPKERNQSITEQVKIRYVLDSEGKAEFENCNVLCYASLTASIDNLSEAQAYSDTKLAYILFTSGSTGRPKGVQISRGNVAAFIDSFFSTGIQVDESDRCMQAFDLTFDVSVQNYLVALISGACLFTVPYGKVKYLYVASLFQKQHITFASMAPSMLTYLRPYFDELDVTSLKTCILTAEACPVDLICVWGRCAVNADLYDFYGPTEATVYCTYYHYCRDAVEDSYNGIVSIGQVMKNVEALILNDDGIPVSGQEKGELCIAGEQLSIGYWDNEERNVVSFFERIQNGKLSRFYHTGDLCFYNERGCIMYCGRIDQQAKIQGYRVELGEIEYHTMTFYENQRRVVAIAYQNKHALTEIALFVEGQEENPNALRTFLGSKMPQYMIPTLFIYESDFPLNKSDKIDRVKLKEKIIDKLNGTECNY